MKYLLIVLAACASNPPPAAPTPASPAPVLAADAHAQHATHRRFEHADEWVRVFDDPARDAWQMPDKIVAALALAPGMAVADLGAGTGYFEKRLSTAVGETGAVIAIDVEPDMVRYIRERAQREATPNVEARLGTVDDPKLAAASVDRVLIVDTWHHVDGRVAFAKKLAAALKPGGAVFIVDFTLESDKIPKKHPRLAPAQVIDELGQAGLKGAVVEAGLREQYIVKASL